MDDELSFSVLRGGGEVGPVGLLVECADTRVLLDCGTEANGPDDWVDEAGDVDAVWVSHAHLDHCGALPDVIEGRPRLPYYCSRGTEALVAQALESHPDCGAQRARDIADGFRTVGRRRYFEIGGGGRDDTGLRAMAFRAGHILGASMLLLEGPPPDPVRLLYTGDFCCHDQPVVSGARFPETGEDFEVDVLVMEGILATDEGADGVDYGRELRAFVDWVQAADGPVVVAASPMGEAVELAAALREGGSEPVIHDSIEPVVRAYRGRGAPVPDELCAPEPQLERALAEGGVVVAPGDQLGTETAARRLFTRIAGDPEARLAVANRAHDSSLAGRLIVGGSDAAEELEGTDAVRAQTRRFELPNHAPRWQLVGAANAVDPDRVVLVHGAKSQLHALRRAIEQSGFDGTIDIPKRGASIPLAAS